MKWRFAIAVALVAVAIFQPWSYDRGGFADATVAVAGGEISLSLDDHASGEAYCLFSAFKSADEAREPIEIVLDRVGTRLAPELSGRIEKSGTTVSIEGLEDVRSYFDGPAVRFVLPADEPVFVNGSVRYKGAVETFRAELKLQHWEKSRKVIRFCT